MFGLYFKSEICIVEPNGGTEVKDLLFSKDQGLRGSKKKKFLELGSIRAGGEGLCFLLCCVPQWYTVGIQYLLNRCTNEEKIEDNLISSLYITYSVRTLF